MTKPTNADTDTYFICATPRTGSSLLLGLLDSTGVAGHPQAYFRSPDEVAWSERWGIAHMSQGALDYGDFVRAALAEGRTGNGVFGAKLMWGTHAELAGRLAGLHPDLAGNELRLLEREFGRIRFVYLYRDDILAQAVSWLRAEQTGVWFIGGKGEIGGGGAGGGGQGADDRPRFDRDAVTRTMRTIEEHNAGWERWFEAYGVQPHRIRYEDLSADPHAVTHGVLDFLGLALPAGRQVTPSHQRQADRLNEEWMARYRLLPLLQEVFGDDLLGVHLHGSAVLGGLRPDSDLDVLVVVRRRMSDGQRRVLVRELMAVSGRGAHRPVELIVVVQDDVRPWRYPPNCEFLYGEWLRGGFECGVVPEAEVSPDLAPLISMVLLGDTPLYGPPPAELLDPVPHADLLRGIVAGVPQLMADLDTDTRNVLLTLARVRSTLATGAIRSKDGAADWVLERLPAAHRPVLERARDGYLGLREDRWGDLLPEARDCAASLVSAIEGVEVIGGSGGIEADEITEPKSKPAPSTPPSPSPSPPSSP
ncbi:aminoglycoside adenylyltransferase family protein [Streptomyces pseudovenezuelae]|uniref:LPS sulfotransferase NodH n=1 Tax=Streptomyces pseudovenezuelae TaxID=67350 RepID=A0ABT6LPX9_9ACTN|nr:aminoglycoside adenylyltransferase family protein [Streptomyces pseudovenezuelae]MDH6218357.1 LPS sulfotransferase NodH [Streptomyces pseudovenezuelae]